jgi:uncharacterized protein with FMN-binding domain
MWLVATVCGLVLLFSYRTSTMGARGTDTAANAQAAGGMAPGIVSGGGPTDPTAAPSSAPSATGAATPPATPTPTPASGGSKTGQNVVVNGTVAQTRWGPVQVQVRIAGGKISEVTVLQQPNGNRRDVEINSYALPVLHDEVLNAQSAQIDTVSGATVTSNGYIQSLQSALDTAHFRG